MTTKQDRTVIDLIAKRAIALGKQHGINYPKINAVMDIESAHGDIPLRLSALLKADDFNFAHDVFGIRRHMDRTIFPGVLTDCFVPRYARHPLP